MTLQLGFEVFHRDVRVLVDFYVDVLGFESGPVDDPADYVMVRRDGVRVGCCAWADADATERRPPHGSEIVLRVADVEVDHRRVVAAGWPLADPLQQRPWGLTDFRVFDPSGQYLRITQASAVR
jgi:predicted enzyme related to lactoylglutathione lyase